MSQNLAIHPVGQVPKVTSPNLLDLKMVHQLAAYRLYPSANPFTDPNLTLIKFGGLTILGGYRKLKSLIDKKFLLERFRQISSVAQKQTSVTSSQFSYHMKVMDIGSSKAKGLDHTQGVDFYVKPETIKSLIAKLLAISRQAFKELTAFGPDKFAYSYGEAVQDQNGVGKWAGYMLEQFLFNRPQVCSMSDETNATSESGKVMSVESFEQIKDGFVPSQAQEFADDFHGKYFTVRKLWQWSSSSEGSLWKIFFHKIIYLAEDIYDKIIEIHFLPSIAKGTNIYF